MLSIEKENNNNPFTLLSFSRERLISTSQPPTSLPLLVLPSGAPPETLIHLIHRMHRMHLTHLDLEVHMELCVRICTLIHINPP